MRRRRTTSDAEMSASMLLQRLGQASILFVDKLFRDPANYKAKIPPHERRRVRPNEGGIHYEVSFYAVHYQNEEDGDVFIGLEEQEESTETKRAYNVDLSLVPPRLEISLQKFDALKYHHPLTSFDKDKIGVTLNDPLGQGHFEFFLFCGRFEDLKASQYARIHSFILRKLKGVAAFAQERAHASAAKRLRFVR